MRSFALRVRLSCAAFAAAILAVCPAWASIDIGEHFAKPESWEESAVDFTVRYQKDGFKFASQKRDIVNCLVRGAATWCGREVWEAKVYYADNKPVRVEMSLYNHGDDKKGEGLSMSAFKDMEKAIGEKVDPSSKTLPTAKKREIKGGYQFVRKWIKTDPNVELTWGVNGKGSKDAQISYVRAVLTPKGKTGPVGATKSVAGVVSITKAKSNVRKSPEGDVMIANVPMVDQGQKGYCAVAVSERVLRYFGYPIDEHELAQLAGSSGQNGTSIDSMMSTVRAVGSKCRLGYNEIVFFGGDYKAYVKELDKYNKAAKAEKEPQLSMDRFLHGNSLDVAAMQEAMRPQVIKRMRVKDGQYKKFLESIKKQIDLGNPVFWGVTLGRYPEPEIPQAKGGHMRLIIGYNKQTHEILYSDSWGAGHECKRMPEDWAFAITDAAFFLRPL